ncbi:MAG TPA: 50S ribosomal protein L15 [Candidatus Pacebacteria bacterium]|nr:50S ribosomal protein L15 [Candidatus Paceibacterota bacterium]
MQIHEVSTIKKDKKRIGRGGKRGTYSGKGMKGQKSRSGGNVNPLFEGGRTTLVQKMKKNRGFKSPHPKKITVSLTKLDVLYSDGDTVSVETLVQKKILRAQTIKNRARIVATGEITKKLTINEDISVTTSAKEKIEKAGGKVEIAKEIEDKTKKNK